MAFFIIWFVNLVNSVNWNAQAMFNYSWLNTILKTEVEAINILPVDRVNKINIYLQYLDK